MKAAIILFPGSNRERDLTGALKRVTGREPILLWHRETQLPEVDLIALPGGFAHGDYLRPGAIAAHSPIMHAVERAARAGRPVLGICNGFQILTEAGILPGALLPNRSLAFACRDVHLRVEESQSIFTCGYEAGAIIGVPVAHHDGNYTAPPKTLDRLEGEGLVAFRYCGPDGALDEEANFNGSLRAIAGILNEGRNVLGLMPHPEDAADPLLGGTDGLAFFEGLASALL